MTAPSSASGGMEIWVDADACPAAIKEIVFRAAIRTQVRATLVANRLLRTPPSPWVRAIQVPGGFDVADQRIAAEARAGDLVITADVPLAGEVIPRGVLVLTPRGERYTPENIGERLTMRDFMDQMRGSGFDTGGPAPLGQGDRHAFASELDRILAAYAARLKIATPRPEPAPAPPPDGDE